MTTTAILLVAVVAIALAAAGHARTLAHRARHRWSASSGVAGRAVRTLLVTAVAITGVQWAVLATVHDWRVVLAVLALPALATAAGVAALVAITGAAASGRAGVRW